jgi:dTDP-4-amino-4,6-dideoxygalactose transaminase
VTVGELPFLDLRPGDDAAAIRTAIDRVLARGWFVLGPELEAFEHEFAQASGARHAVGVGHGTDAISLLLRAAGVGTGDEVIVPALTAAFSALAVTAIGARPVIADVDPETLLLDVAGCERNLTPRVKAILPVHLYGQAADMQALAAFAARHRLAIVEDCCQAHLATSRGQPVGTFGVGGAFSFYPTKNLAALGDAGAVATNDESVARTITKLRNGGQRERYVHEIAGVNSRLDEIQAAVLRARLQTLAAETARRREIAGMYRGRLSALVDIPRERDAGHVYHLFPVRSPRRDALQAHLRQAGIGTLVHYPWALSSLAAFSPYRREACEQAERAGAELLSLPLNPRLSDADVERVASAVERFGGQQPG